MKIVITGAAGFIGSHLVNYCIKQGHTVTLIDNDARRLHDVFSNIPENRLATFWRLIDVAKEANLLEEYFKVFKPDVCYCLSSYASEGRSNHIRSFIHHNNTVGTANVINACVNHKCKLVFTSSVAVYSGAPPFDETMLPNPIDEYGLSKYMSERSIQIAGDTQGLDWCIIRPRNVYGPGQNIFDRSRNLFGIWCYNALNDIPLTIFGAGSNRRSFTFIDDIIRCIYKAKDIESETINLGSRVAYSILEAYEVFSAVTGYHKFQFLPARHEVADAFCGISKSSALLNFNQYTNTSLDQGLIKMWAWAQTIPMRDLDKMPNLEVQVNAHSSLK